VGGKNQEEKEPDSQENGRKDKFVSIAGKKTQGDGFLIGGD
jgi:hypothetical protein